MLLSYQNEGQNHNIKSEKRSFDNVEQFKYLGITVKHQKWIKEEVKRRLNSGNAWYHSGRNILSSHLLH
jgi:hypothetical protein